MAASGRLSRKSQSAVRQDQPMCGSIVIATGLSHCGKARFLICTLRKEVKCLITKAMKEKMLAEITEDLQEAELVVVTDYRGLNVKTINDLRGKLRSEQCRYRITKNTMNRLACRQAGYTELESFFEGPTAIAYSSADPVAVAKILTDFAKDYEALVVKGGMFSGQVVDAVAIKDLGEIPPREVLLARVVGGFQSPISGLANVLQGNLRNLVYALDAVRQQKESA